MANIVVARAFWFSVGSATDMQSGQVHGWIWGLGTVSEAITITPSPRASFNTGVLIVEDLRISDGFRGRLAEFVVRNVGSTPIHQYALTGSFIS